MIRLLLDMGLPRRAAGDLRGQGWDVLHISELGMSQAQDTEVLARAAHEDRALITLDSDFARLVALGSLSKPSLVHLRMQGIDRHVTVRILTGVIPRILDDLEHGCIASVTEGGLRVRRLPVRPAGA